MNNLLEDFNQSLHKGFIDRTISHKGNFMPKLLVNNNEENVLQLLLMNYINVRHSRFQSLLSQKVD